MGFFKKAEAPPNLSVAPAAPGPVPMPYPTVGPENSFLKDQLAGPASSTGNLSLPQGPSVAAPESLPVLGAFGKSLGPVAVDDTKLSLPKTQEAGIRRQMDTALRTARRAGNPAAMIAALDTMRPLGESLAPTEAGKSAWRGFISDARRMWESVDRASGSSHSAFPASSKGGGGSTLGFPDVCKVPAPPAPFAPAPFPNLANLPDVSIDVPSPDEAAQGASDAGGAVQEAVQEGAEAAGEAAQDAAEQGQEVASNAQDTGEDAVNTVKGWLGH